MKEETSAPTPQVLLKPVAVLSDSEARALVRILNEDTALRQRLYPGDAPRLTLDEFRRVGQAWQADRDAITYCIFAPGPVGQISLSRIHQRQACIGYWLASRAWDRGIMSEAFRQVLEIAREHRILQVTASIQSGNPASLHLWEKYGAQLQPTGDDRLQVSLDLLPMEEHK
jgi:RimJ/RimL family protein N-acetyltransferase